MPTYKYLYVLTHIVHIQAREEKMTGETEKEVIISER